ncbi:hypothetical protein GmRootA79_23290 [Acidovorax sp. A79]
MHQQLSAGWPAAMAHWFGWPHRGQLEEGEEDGAADGGALEGGMMAGGTRPLWMGGGCGPSVRRLRRPVFRAAGKPGRWCHARRAVRAAHHWHVARRSQGNP